MLTDTLVLDPRIVPRKLLCARRRQWDWQYLSGFAKHFFEGSKGAKNNSKGSSRTR